MKNKSECKKIASLDLISEANWEAIKGSAHEQYRQMKLSLFEEQDYLYLVYAIQFWMRTTFGNYEEFNPLGNGKFEKLSDEELRNMLITDHNRKNVLSLFTGSRKAGRYEIIAFDNDRKIQRGITHDIRVFSDRDDSLEQREFLSLVPFIVFASYQKESQKETLTEALWLDSDSVQKTKNGLLSRIMKILEPQKDYYYDEVTQEFTENYKNPVVRWLYKHFS